MKTTPEIYDEAGRLLAEYEKWAETTEHFLKEQAEHFPYSRGLSLIENLKEVFCSCALEHITATLKGEDVKQPEVAKQFQCDNPTFCMRCQKRAEIFIGKIHICYGCLREVNTFASNKPTQLCVLCNKQEATVHITEAQDGHDLMTKMHLCEPCVKTVQSLKHK